MRVKKWNDSGALEGLPLYLIILVVITAVAIVAILGFMPTTKMLDTIVVNEPADGSITTAETGPIVITAYDTKSNTLTGVNIVIEGHGSVGTGLTGEDGTANITLDKSPTLVQNQNVGQLTVTATYEGIVKTTVISVVKP